MRSLQSGGQKSVCLCQSTCVSEPVCAAVSPRNKNTFKQTVPDMEERGVNKS